MVLFYFIAGFSIDLREVTRRRHDFGVIDVSAEKLEVAQYKNSSPSKYK